MTTEFPAIDRDKDHLIDADRDAVRIADALLGSPHILSAHAEPGDDTVTFATRAGAGYALTLQDAEPTTDDILPEPVLTETVAAAILNHPDFCVATPDHPREDTITVQTRSGDRYLLALDVDPDAGHGDLPTPAEDVAYAADRLLTSNPDGRDRAVAELLNYLGATWEKQDTPLRQHAQAVARSVRP
ncbi:hypothetical protein GCM10012285_66070 [Streptomyces kronopolitis]|uniref:Uncharacterized protein n=1 Tax=Streptomyces kronopolitis TaxID=1612435 RepID=A0ABQ2K3B6_9ACTN|nr:hypothetical protein [Streptomyces kronopolitis]GGN64207.1 hypothetical protein GCM10012285_66070 [Streptomyces kronopolitis]